MAIGQMFAQWKVWFKNKMKPSEWERDTVILWANYLTAKSVTKREFDLAKSLSVDLDFPPNNAKEFLALARKPIASNYPDSHTAFTFACQNEGKTADIKSAYEHVVIYETVRRMGSYALKNASSSDFKTWDRVYQLVCQEHAQGAVFTIPESHRLAVVKQAASSEVVSDVFAKVKAMLAGKAVSA